MAEENIFLFYPNLIGYGRIVIAIISLYLMPTSPCWTAVCYIFSYLLDSADGYAARLFNQCTRFGALLDMLTDRCAFLGLLVGLSALFPQYALAFEMSAIIDVAGHWLFMVASYICGNTSHKSVEIVDNSVIRLYYTSESFMFVMCTGNEIFYCAIYLMKFYSHVLLFGYGLWKMLAILCFPIAVGKAYISLLHLIAASKMLGVLDLRERKEKADQTEKIQ